MLHSKLQKLKNLLKTTESVLIAYSGGIDSSLLFKIAHETLGEHALAVTAVSPTFPSIELELARNVAQEIGGRHMIIHTDQLALPEFTLNDASRCFHCKTDLYQALRHIGTEQGIATICDGTNLDDLGDDRPGITAAKEWGVRSLLVEAACSKQDVRTMAKELGLSNWDKPAAACLSSRIPRGLTITKSNLYRVEQAEAVLFREGFKQVRVRDQGNLARIELDREELPKIVEPNMRGKIITRLKQLGFRFVTVDLEGYQTGSTNENSS